jgi:hypothetical protein
MIGRRSFSEGKAKFGHVTGPSHDAFRWPSGVWAQQYKSGVATFAEESLVLMNHLHGVDCNDGDAVINTATREQNEAKSRANIYKHGAK